MGRRFDTLQFPGGKTKAFTLSYDDGVIQDRRLAELRMLHRRVGALPPVRRRAVCEPPLRALP